MIQLILRDVKCLRLNQTENVYAGENKISEFSVILPEKITQYKTAECEIEMRSFVSEDKYISNQIDTSTRNPKVPITSDLTEKAQIVPIMFFITHEGNVIGKTNFEKLNVLESKDGSTPLDPREELDEIIAELRAENAAQAQTIASQATAIEAKDGQISELNGQVTELEAENAEQAQTITRQNTTIDELNTRRIPVYIEPNLESKEITPLAETRYYGPSEGKDGFSSVTVDGVTVEGLGLNENYYKLGEPFLNKVGTYHPFPENSYGGIYFTELNEDDFPVGIKVVNYDYNYNNFSIPVLNTNTLKNNIKSFILLGCKNVKIGDRYFENAISLMICQLDGVLSIGGSAFNNCTSLTELTLPDSLTIIGVSAFYNCTSLTELTLPDSLTSIDNYAFQQCTSLTEINLPDSLTSIGDRAFQNCSSLTELTLPDSLTSIGGNAFNSCTSLTELTLPDSLTSIGAYAFYNCFRLNNLTLAQGFNCNGLNVSSSTRFTAETIVACLEALADRTGQTAYTITFGSTNLNKLTNEQKAIATNKNWNLA